MEKITSMLLKSLLGLVGTYAWASSERGHQAHAAEARKDNK